MKTGSAMNPTTPAEVRRLLLIDQAKIARSIDFIERKLNSLEHVHAFRLFYKDQEGTVGVAILLSEILHQDEIDFIVRRYTDAGWGKVCSKPHKTTLFFFFFEPQTEKQVLLDCVFVNL